MATTTLTGRIRRLTEATINRIAAGEVVERPASVVKELVENSLDAQADRIVVEFEDGGRRLIRVSDNGSGIPGAQLRLAVERHATSKLEADDLQNIRTMGFRGEALAAIAGVSRFSIVTRAGADDHGWELQVDAGEAATPKPAAGEPGTTVEVQDLFYATPARAGFLRSTRAEGGAIVDVMRNIAIAHPAVTFVVRNESREVLNCRGETGDLAAARQARIGQVLGAKFLENAVAVAGQRTAARLSGFAALPTFHRNTGQQQYVFVNGRPVRDRAILGAVRGAYRDLLPRGTFPVHVIWLDVEPDRVDVNVHPAKSEVRFRDAAEVRGLVVSSIREALVGAGHRASTEGGQEALASFRRFTGYASRPAPGGTTSTGADPQLFVAPPAGSEPDPAVVESSGPTPGDFPLGAARAQLHRTFIVAQTEDGLVIVDQHAAHERLIYELIKADLERAGVTRSRLLIPDIVKLGPGEADRLLARREELAELGLVIETFSPDSVCVREVPEMLHNVDVESLLRELADDLAEWDEAVTLRSRLDAVCSRMACHGSIRGGQSLTIEQMNGLLRKMEKTPHSGQCNHGRPTYVELKLKDLEKLFERR